MSCHSVRVRLREAVYSHELLPGDNRDEPFDRIEYENGNVPAGGRVTLRLVISQPASLHEPISLRGPSAGSKTELYRDGLEQMLSDAAVGLTVKTAKVYAG